MTKEKWKLKVDELIDIILEKKESAKIINDDLDGLKSELAELLNENKVNEYIGNHGKANFVDFEREGLIKDEVEITVDKVNKGKINKIDMKDLTKEIKVHFINVRGYVCD